MAVIKTGVILTKRSEPTIDFLTDSYQPGGEGTVYGDLHLIGNCAILYYPKDQMKHNVPHGWVDLDMGYGSWVRHTSPFHILAIPAKQIMLIKGAIHSSDWDLWQRAGGLLDDRISPSSP